MTLNDIPVADTGLLIRKPVAEVFEAIANPAITTRFWFTNGSGRLEAGKQIRWDWAMYGISVLVDVKEVDVNRRILMDWGGPDAPTTVEWRFTSRPDGTTFIGVTNSGFVGSGDEVVKQALGSLGGFSLVLAGLKAFLEHGIELNLVADRFPDGH